MSVSPNAAEAKQLLADADSACSAALTRLTAIETEAAALLASKAGAALAQMIEISDLLAALRRKARVAGGERYIAAGRKERAALVLTRAELLDERSALEKRRAEIEAAIEREYPPLARGIVALMATSRRLQARTRAHLPRLREVLTSAEFCASLQLPDIGTGKRFLWYPADPAALDAIDAPDAVPLDEISGAALAGDAQEFKRAEAAAVGTLKAIAAAYECRGRQIAKLLNALADLDEAALAMNFKAACLGVAPLPINGLWRAVRLPSLSDRKSPLWWQI